MERSRDYFMEIVETVSQPLVVFDDELRVRTANRSYYEAFQQSRQLTEDASVDELERGRWKTTELRGLLSKAAKRDTTEQTVVEQEIPSAGEARAVRNARSFEIEDARRWILLAMEIVDAQNR